MDLQDLTGTNDLERELLNNQSPMRFLNADSPEQYQEHPRDMEQALSPSESSRQGAGQHAPSEGQVPQQQPQQVQIQPAPAATSPSRPSFQQLLTAPEQEVLDQIREAFSGEGGELTMGRGLIIDFIQISKLEGQSRKLLLQILKKNDQMPYINSLLDYFPDVGNQQGTYEARKRQRLQDDRAKPDVFLPRD